MIETRSIWPETPEQLANFTLGLVCIVAGVIGLAHIVIPWLARRKK